MGKFKLKLSFILLLILGITLLTACSKAELSEEFERKEIEAKGKEVIATKRVPPACCTYPNRFYPSHI